MWNTRKEFTLEKSKVEDMIHEPVKEYTVNAGCNAGDGVAASLMSIKTTTVSGKDLHLVYKAIDKSNPFLANATIENGSFVVENATYSTLIPKMTAFGESRGLKGDPLIPVPRLYDIYKGDDPIDDYICMEDVRPLGFTMINKYSGLTLEEMSLVMKEIAKFHAIGYALIRDEGEQIFRNELAPFVRYFMSSSESPYYKGFPVLLHGCLNNSVELVATVDKPLAEKMKSHFTPYMAINDTKLLYSLSFDTDTKYFPVLVHGDFWSNNIMFKYEGTSPVALRIIDFQYTRRGNIYEDLVYLINTSTTAAFRRQHLLPVLNIYFNEFMHVLDQLEVPPPVGFTIGKFLDSFYENIPFGFRYLQFAIPLQLGVSLEAAGSTLAEQMKNHGEEGRTGPLAENENSNGPPSVEEAMKGMIKMMKVQVECESRALDRIVEVAQEMADLKFI